MDNYKEYKKIALIAARKIVGKRKAHLEDCFQVGLSTIALALKSYTKEKGSLNTYLYRCAYNRILNYLRDNQIWEEIGIWEKTQRNSRLNSYERYFYDHHWFELLDSLDEMEKQIFQRFFIDKCKKITMQKKFKLTAREFNNIINCIKFKIQNDLK